MPDIPVDVIMDLIFLQRHRDCRKLIIIFSGWSTSAEFYSNLKSADWDIAVVSNYSDLSFDSAPLQRYSSIFVIAWSLGIVAAAHVSNFIPKGLISAAFAVNGSLHPANDDLGIPITIYNSTEENLSPRNLMKFRKRMGLPQEFISTCENEDIDSLKYELIKLRDDVSPAPLPWKRVYIGINDKIFPPQSMVRDWENNPSSPQIVRIEAPHYINLQYIIDEVTPNHSIIARRFRNALNTYDSAASAQSSIIDNLLNLIPLNMKNKPIDIIEIGVGSGMLSRRLPDNININSAQFVDLNPLPELNIAPKERYFVADAEEWIEDAEDNSADLIISANTIQWFADQDRFFRNAAKVLRSSGTLVCSSFLPGNLAELDILRPSPLLYHCEESLREMLKRYFNNFGISSKRIALSFASSKELMMHLKHTGVAGGTSLSPSSTRHFLSQLPSPPSLTYLPVFITAHKD